MSRERAFIGMLRGIATDPAARGLADDCAVLPMGERDLVLTHDMLVEGVHFLPDDPPGDVAWKLVAVNLSDLAAKGARPIGVLLGYPLGIDTAWDVAFVEGLGKALTAFGVGLFGGDTVAAPGSARQFGLTAIGEVAAGGAPSRAGAQAGDGLWVTGLIGAAGLGLAMAKAPSSEAVAAWVLAYRRPWPRLREGQALAPLVHAMCDVSDGLLIDASRMAEASGLTVEIDLDRVPLPDKVESSTEVLLAATAGDDYELLFALPAGRDLPAGVAATRIGQFSAGRGLTLRWQGVPIVLPARLGYEHGA